MIRHLDICGIPFATPPSSRNYVEASMFHLRSTFSDISSFKQSRPPLSSLCRFRKSDISFLSCIVPRSILLPFTTYHITHVSPQHPTFSHSLIRPFCPSCSPLLPLRNDMPWVSYNVSRPLFTKLHDLLLASIHLAFSGQHLFCIASSGYCSPLYRRCIAPSPLALYYLTKCCNSYPATDLRINHLKTVSR